MSTCQDNDGAEIDALLVRDGAWAGVEVRLSGAVGVLDIAAATGLAHHLDPTDTGTLHTAAIRYQRALDEIAQHSGLAA